MVCNFMTEADMGQFLKSVHYILENNKCYNPIFYFLILKLLKIINSSIFQGVQYGDTILVSEGISYKYILTEGGNDTILHFRTKKWFLCIDMCVCMCVCVCVCVCKCCMNLCIMCS